jgi:hypothetical protein
MLDRQLFRFGQGFFFEPLGNLVLSLFDFMVLIVAGTLTYLTLKALENKVKSAV